MSVPPDRPGDNGLNQCSPNDGQNQSSSDDTGGEAGCFVAGTLVATEKGPVSVEAIEIGDEICAFDLGHGIQTVQTVLKTFKATRREMLVLYFEGEMIRCTPSHEFYAGQWVPARQLRVGDRILSRNGQWKELKSIERETQPQPIFNLSVGGALNYFVGKSELLVHNKINLSNPDEEEEVTNIG
jgi:hypothetical protein